MSAAVVLLSEGVDLLEGLVHLLSVVMVLRQGRGPDWEPLSILLLKEGEFGGSLNDSVVSRGLKPGSERLEVRTV